MNDKYKPTVYSPIDTKLAYLSEEACEVGAAIGKTFRFGLDSSNPEIPEEERITNGKWLWNEIQDLKYAIRLVESTLEANGYH